MGQPNKKKRLCGAFFAFKTLLKQTSLSASYACCLAKH
jgi:hypothetical protein